MSELTAPKEEEVKTPSAVNYEAIERELASKRNAVHETPGTVSSHEEVRSEVSDTEPKVE
jgi:hypothetical protein